MDQDIVARLEACAQIVSAPSQLVSVSTEQFKEAQQVFIDFQKTKTPFELCRYILETSEVPYVQFQAASCLKNGAIRDWSFLREENLKLHLLNYLLEYVSTREELQNFVREQLLLVCAVILKRCGIDESAVNSRLVDDNGLDSPQPSVLASILNSVLAAITAPFAAPVPSPGAPAVEIPSYVRRLAACSFVLAILNEYSSSTRASDFGLPWIKHLETKKKFEINHLKTIFSSGLTALHNLFQYEPNPEALKTPRMLTLLAKLIQILETIFTWNFDLITIISSQYAKHVDSIECPVLQPGVDWRDIFVNEQIIQFIFYIYVRVRTLEDENLMHHALQCLSQLSSLTGSIISNPKNRIQFLGNFLSGTLHLLKNGFAHFEVVSISSMLHRICQHLQSRDTIKLVSKESSLQFVTMLSDVTCKLLVDCMQAEQGKSLEDESNVEKYKQAIDNLCDAWMVLLQAIEKYERYFDESPTDEVDGNVLKKHSQSSQDVIDPNVMNACARQIFECYLRCHLTQPEGLRQIVSFESDVQDFEEEDNITYFEQLNAIGCLARVDALHAITCLTEILNLRVTQLQNCLQSMAENPGTNRLQEQWTSLNEDIHWILMIAIWTLTQSNYGERDLIPQQILQLSISSSSDLSATLQALRTCDFTFDSHKKVDPVIKLIVVVFKLCSLEKYIHETRMQHLVSPQVSLTLTFFITRFMCGYLLPNENDYTDMSMTLNACFGRDSQPALTTLNFLIEHILTKLFLWPAESEVTEASATCLVTFVQNSADRCKAVTSCRSIEQLLQKHVDNQLQNLSMTARKSIYQLFALMASHKADLWEKVFDPLKTNYIKIKALMEAGDRSESTRNYLIEFCESICGVSSGTTANNITKIWNHGSGNIYLSDVADIVNAFHNYNDVVIAILEFVSTATNKILCFLEANETIQFYEGTINILSVYAKHNKNRLTVESTADEDAYNDILLIMQILNDLAAKDFIDWYPPIGQGAGDVDNSPSQITATQVVFIGLDIVMPLMSPQLLEFPKMSQNYYKLIGFLCEDPDRLHEIPQTLMESVMASITHALKSTFSSEIKCNCLSMLAILGNHCLRDSNQFQALCKLLEPFLGVILEFTLLDCGSSKDVTLRENVAHTMFTLICVFPQTYQDLVERLIATQVQRSGDLALESHLRKAFNTLMSNIPLNSNRVHRSAFKQRFETFVAEIQGLLYIK